jgi:electron-transferring-flavoprotein dehydrogenase
MTRDVMAYDVLIVGAGPAGLACAIRLRQLRPQLRICVIEKGAAVGAHAVSGAVFAPAALDELVPDWRASPPAICVAVERDEFMWLTRTRAWHLPTPPPQRNRGNFIISLGQLLSLLAGRAEALGIDVFCGYAASAPLYAADGAVAGVLLGDFGRRRDGSEGPNFSLGAELRAPITLIAEGCRGSLAKELIGHFGLQAAGSPQSYALGFKELWQLPAGRSRTGLVQHTVGWPLDTRTYGGGFIYHLPGDRLYIGFVTGLDYRDPRFDPFEAFQQFKHHPKVGALLQGGEPEVYGARAIVAGGWQALPKLEMPGAALLGDAGGTLNVARLKGIHQAMRSGMLAAEHIAASNTIAGFDAVWRRSAAAQELRAVRNIKPGFKYGLWFGLANGLLETLARGRTPWTLAHRAAHPLSTLAATATPGRAWRERNLPPRDRSAAVYLAALSHDEDQPVHLRIADPDICVQRCTQEYGNPCTRFCPAAVYEMIDAPGGRRLQINAANCVHCKACDIKDPYEIITWHTPEGGAGPNYMNF